MKDVGKILAAVFGLILVYLLVSQADKVNGLLSSTGKFFLQGTALLQGRPDVVGVTK